MTKTDGILGVAQFSRKIFEIGKSLKLEIKYKFPIGLGIITNKNSALIRPFNKVFDENKLPGKVVYLFHKDGKEFRVRTSIF